MIVSQLVSATLAMGLENLLQARYGGAGLLCVLLLGVGIKAHHAKCAGLGAVLLVLLMLQA
ncbi:hypothetical protein [Streptomyces sp. NPDC005435]|uniref:hypothetical protein n=1 Tax=Streptomyces sp. NPDC005435 TaxID=3154464 RepID=UPI00345687DD